MQSSMVSPTAFYSNPSEKTKLNWFCYEYASEIISHIEPKLQKRLNRKGVPDKQIVDFAVHFAKHMKKIVATQMFVGESGGVPMSYHDIEKVFPRLDDKLVDDLLTVVAEAWESLLEICCHCPSRCVSEAGQLTSSFDDPNL